MYIRRSIIFIGLLVAIFLELYNGPIKNEVINIIELLLLLYWFSLDWQEEKISYKLLFEFNNILQSSRSKRELFNGICKLIVNQGEFSSCWFGFINQNKIKADFYYGSGITTIQDIEINTKNKLYIDFIQNKIKYPKQHKTIYKYRWNEFFYLPIYLKDKVIGIFAVYSRTITKKNQTTFINLIKLLEQFLLKHEIDRVYKYSFKYNLNGIMITDTHNEIIKVNDKFTEITGYNNTDVQNKNPNILSSGLQNQTFYKQMWLSIKKNGNWSGEISNKKKNGQIYPQYVSINCIYNEDNEIVNYIAIFYDLSTIKEKDNEIEFLKHHDEHSKLYNIKYTEKKFKEINKIKEKIIIFILIKVGDLKIDFGFKSYEEILNQIANRLISNSYKTDIVCRLNLNNFLIISHIQNIKNANIICDKLLKILNSSYLISDNLLIDISINLGVSIFTEHSNSFNELLEMANQAANKSKQIGPNTYSFYDSSMVLELHYNFLLAAEIRNSIINNKLTVTYTPIVNIIEKKIEILNASIRWNSKNIGIMDQPDFQHIMNNLNLTLEFETFLLKEIFRDIKIFQTFQPNIKIQIQIDNFNLLNGLLNEVDIDPNCLIINISSWNTINELINLHKSFNYLEISINSNNNGFGNLLFLPKNIISFINIDKTIIHNIHKTYNNKCVFETISQIANKLNFKIIAEGISSNDELDELNKLNCNYCHGQYISERLNKSELIEFFNILI
jgi:PAS domain S-box-containing protein/diguanylate cyclase (GGDEF)-like protein